MAILEDAKLRLRLSNDIFDDEVTDLISACKTDLLIAGILVTDEEDSLTKKAILTYVKAHFGYDNPDYEKLVSAYLTIKSQMASSNEYAFYKVTINAAVQGIIIFDGISKESNSSGVAVFSSRAKDHVKYVVDGVTNYIDITGTTVIGGE
jgi:hypothetical protein